MVGLAGNVLLGFADANLSGANCRRGGVSNERGAEDEEAVDGSSWHGILLSGWGRSETCPTG